uniref:Uncharacterized protein n=1 Tax=Anguilla anguilla TaxID=7936 RepID=A0A0E9XCM0_ANGAN
MFTMTIAVVQFDKPGSRHVTGATATTSPWYPVSSFSSLNAAAAALSFSSMSPAGNSRV